MQHLPKEYIVLFNAITEAETTLRQLSEQLKRAQLLAEEIYINGENTSSAKADQGNSSGG